MTILISVYSSISSRILLFFPYERLSYRFFLFKWVSKYFDYHHLFIKAMIREKNHIFALKNKI